MPKLINLFGYQLYFYSNERNEPPHVHISKDHQSSSKIWLTPEVKLAHNNADLSDKELKKIIRWLKNNYDLVLQKWNEFFGN